MKLLFIFYICLYFGFVLFSFVFLFACCFYNFSVFISERASRWEALGKVTRVEQDRAAAGGGWGLGSDLGGNQFCVALVVDVTKRAALMLQSRHLSKGDTHQNKQKTLEIGRGPQ